jgi:hypothetical protein
VILSLVEDRSGDASNCRQTVAQVQESGERSPAHIRRLEQRCALLTEEAVDSDVSWLLPFAGGLLVAGGAVMRLNESGRSAPQR